MSLIIRQLRSLGLLLLLLSPLPLLAGLVLYSFLNPSLPAEVSAALKSTKTAQVTLYSLQPAYPMVEENSPTKFHGYIILGQTKLTPDQARLACQTILSQIPFRRIDPPICFNPRHGLSIKSADVTYDLVICYECYQIRSYIKQSSKTEHSFQGSPDVLNALLIAAGIQLKPETF